MCRREASLTAGRHRASSDFGPRRYPHQVEDLLRCLPRPQHPGRAFKGAGAQAADLGAAAEMVERGEVDLVAVGRALLVDPQWAAKVRDGRELVAFSPAAFKTLS